MHIVYIAWVYSELTIIVTIQLVDILARQVTVFGCVCRKRRRQGRRLEPTWPVHVPDGTGISHLPVGQIYSRRFPEDMPGNSDELAGTE